MPIQIFIDGSAGTTGLRIVQRLAERAKTEPLTVRMLEGEQRKDLAARIDAINRSDVAFLCLPDAAAREIVPHIDPAVRVLDTSTAHRTAPGWVYGLPELHGTRAALKTAARVAVPGCHATGFIALAAPLVQAGLLPAGARLSCTSLTGYSGGGKTMIADYEADGRPARARSLPPLRPCAAPQAPARDAGNLRAGSPAAVRAGAGRLLRRDADHAARCSRRSTAQQPEPSPARWPNTTRANRW